MVFDGFSDFSVLPSISDVCFCRVMLVFYHGREDLVSVPSIWSPWMSVSKVWKGLEPLVHCKLGNGLGTSFWSDSWNQESRF